MVNKKLSGFFLGFILAGATVLAAIPEAEKAQQIFRNLLSNPGAENGLAAMTSSGGTFTRITALADFTKVGSGNAAFSWDSSSASQTLTATPQTIPAGWYGKNGVLSCNIQTPSGTATHTLGLWDGTTLSQATTITSSANYARTTLNFIMPSSGTLGYRFTSVASNEPAINIDDCVIGLAEGYNLSQVSQANLIASAYFAATASCEWQASGTSYGDFGTVAACPGPTVDFSNGVTVLTTDTDLPQITLNNLPSGRYRVTATGTGTQGASGVIMGYAISDGTTRDGDAVMRVSVSNSDLPQFTVIGVFEYTTAQTSKTFKMQGASSASNTRIDNGNGFLNNTKGLRFTVERFPTSSEIGYRPEMINWRVDANISGANPDLGTSAQSSYIGIENSSLTLTNNTSSMATILTAQIPCSSTNSPTGTTCSVGNESVGVSFTLPVAGDVEACVAFAHNQDNASNQSTPTFQIVETPNNAQTISQEGKSRIQTGRGTTATSSEFQGMNLCGTFSFSTSGQKTLRLMYEQPAAAGINTLIADAASTAGQRDIHWTVRPLTQAITAPVLVGSVTSNSPGLTRTEYALIAGDGSCTILSQSGSWLSSTTHNSTGDCTLTIAGGMFSARPICNVTVEATNVFINTGQTKISTTSAPSATLIRFTTANSSGTLVDLQAGITCIGPR